MEVLLKILVEIPLYKTVPESVAVEVDDGKRVGKCKF
jgi:hypothetical protein